MASQREYDTVTRMSLEAGLAQYDFPFSPRYIATEPASPRDSAKLAVYDRATGATMFDTFLHLDRYLPKGALLILNDTKVVPARIPCFLPTGGKVELLWLRTLAGIRGSSFEALSPRTLSTGDTLRFGTLTLTVQAKNGSVYTFAHTGTQTQFRAAMTKLGTTPIPPYMKSTSLSERDLRREYQTIFAKHAGSAAAPTASLHFTPRLLKKLKAKGFDIAYVTLHVGLGTFAPLTPEHLKTGKLHEEWYEIPPATARAIAKAKREGRAVIPVGTTALRTVESAFSTPLHHPESGGVLFEALQCDGAKPDFFSKKKAYSKRISPLSGTTTLFIRPGYKFKVADGLITNFHVPRSSLLMLVAALVGCRPGRRPADGRKKILALYRSAIRRGFRLFSFGDGMLIR